MRSGKITRRRETDPDKLKPAGVVLNRKDLRKFQHIAQNHRDAEYIYLRENEFVDFDPYITLEHLKTLDLSMNLVSGTINFLTKTPALRHLYMTSNKIESLAGVCGLHNLETLCLSDNLISSFEGLDALPNLRLLSMNYNQISSFHMYPHLPQLHTLNLVGNPLVQIPSYRGMAIALSTPHLVSIDGKPVEEEERNAVEHHRGKIVFCIAEGFVIEGDDVEESADKFLLNFQRKINEDKPLRLQSIRLTSEDTGSSMLTEGIPVKLNMCLQDLRDYNTRLTDIFFSRHFFPVIFKVSGEATEAFVVGSMNQWTDPIPLERCEADGEVFFHTTLYLPAGDYEYRYVVDGEEKVSEEHKVTSKFKKGECNLYHVTEPDQEESDTDSLFYIRWMRSDVNNGFTLIPDENGLMYVPSGEDVGFCLRAEVLVYVQGDFSFQYFDISTPVNPGPPKCTHLQIVGDACEGEVLTVQATYSGGTEGNSGISWFRIMPDDEEVPIELEDGWAGYELTLDDIGCRIRVEFTPVRNDWVAGLPVSDVTPVVAAGVPCCRDIKIIGDPVQDQPLFTEVVYSGGVEGESVYQWFRHDDKSDEFFPIPDATKSVYQPTLADVGKIIAVEYTPVSKDHIEGEVCRCVLDKVVEPAEPRLRSLAIHGEPEEGQVLHVEYEYYGGYFGNHHIHWYRREAGKNVRIGHSNSPTLTLTNKEVGCIIEVAFVPVRSDGVQGKGQTCATDEPVRPSFPTLGEMSISGEPAVDSVLTINAEYSGGTEGESLIEWTKVSPGGRVSEVVATNVKEYTVQRKDAGFLLKVAYTPIRSDGVVGETKRTSIEIPSLPVTTPEKTEVVEKTEPEAPATEEGAPADEHGGDSVEEQPPDENLDVEVDADVPAPGEENIAEDAPEFNDGAENHEEIDANEYQDAAYEEPNADDAGNADDQA